MFKYYKPYRQQKGSNQFLDIIQPRRYDIKQKKADVLSKIVRSRKKLKVSSDLQKKFDKNNPKIESLEHFSESQFSVKIQPQIKIPTRALPRQQTTINPQDLQQEYSHVNSYQKALAQRARQFIKRLRKSKQYNQGRHIILRKKQESRKQQEKRKQQQERQHKYAQFKQQKLNKIMDNILSHEERTCRRLGLSINKLRRSVIRSKTEVSQRGDYLAKNSSFTEGKQVPMIQSFKRRLQDLQKLTESLVRYED